jgi:hypothetical protein
MYGGAPQMQDSRLANPLFNFFDAYLKWEKMLKLYLTKGFANSIALCDSNRASEIYDDSSSFQEPLGWFSILAYVRAFTQSVGEPESSKLYNIGNYLLANDNE